MPTDKQIEAYHRVAWAAKEFIDDWKKGYFSLSTVAALDAQSLDDALTNLSAITAAEQAQKCSSPNCECMFPRDCPAEPEYEQAQEAQPDDINLRRTLHEAAQMIARLRKGRPDKHTSEDAADLIKHIEETLGRKSEDRA